MKKALHGIALMLLLLLPHSSFGVEPDETGLKTGGEREYTANDWIIPICGHHQRSWDATLVDQPLYPFSRQ